MNPDLPIEIQHKIFDYIPYQYIYNLKKVCKDWEEYISGMTPILRYDDFDYDEDDVHAIFKNSDIHTLKKYESIIFEDVEGDEDYWILYDIIEKYDVEIKTWKIAKFFIKKGGYNIVKAVLNAVILSKNSGDITKKMWEYVTNKWGDNFYYIANPDFNNVDLEVYGIIPISPDITSI